MPISKNHHSRHPLSLALLAGALLLCACEKEQDFMTKPQQQSDAVLFNIEQTDGWAPDVIDGGNDKESTRKTSSTRTTSLPMECADGDSLATRIFMYMTEEDCPPMVDTLQNVTRDGEQATPAFGVYAYQMTGETAPESYVASNATTFMDNINLSTYGTADNEYKYWPGSGSWLQFFAYWPHSTEAIAKVDSEGSFAIEATDLQPTFTYTVPTDPTKQVDLMDGKSALIAGNVTDAVAISLSHAMSQIQVKAGTLDEGKILSISFTGIKTTGTRDLAAENGWTISTENANKTTTYTQSWAGGATIGTDNLIGSPMYLMPQDLSDDATISIVMEVTSTDPDGQSRSNLYTLTKNLKQFAATWSPDKKYTYTISTPEEIEVSVDDNVEVINGQKVKKDLVIKNTGLASAYIRVAINGSWVTTSTTGSGESATTQKFYVDAWKDLDGTFVWGNNGAEPTATVPNNNWLKSEDGYYYYMGPVKRNTELKKLFESYTLTAQPPVANAHLELIILAEAIYEGDFDDSGWLQSAKTASSTQP